MGDERMIAVANRSLRSGPPSVFNQGVAVVAIDRGLMDSPRNYNPTMIEWEGRRLMIYRSHRKDTGDGRCALAICELNALWQPGPSQWLDMKGYAGGEHFEDGRAFIHNGRLHLSFVESTFHHPDPYTCVIKYCTLIERKGRWHVDRVWHPIYGLNRVNAGREKNWIFLSLGGELFCLYESDPLIVLKIDGHRVTEVHRGTEGSSAWPWGTIRGGTPFVPQSNGRLLSFFHSSQSYPVAPYYRRYFCAAYEIDPKTWTVARISGQPLIAGSSDDGHGSDPRTQVPDWKPFVTFPMGVIPHHDGWYVSFGLNDYRCAVADFRDLKLGCPQWTDWQPRYFYTENSSALIRVAEGALLTRRTRWTPIGRPLGGVPPGVVEARDPRLALVLAETDGATEINRAEFDRLLTYSL